MPCGNYLYIHTQWWRRERSTSHIHSSTHPLSHIHLSHTPHNRAPLSHIHLSHTHHNRAPLFTHPPLTHIPQQSPSVHTHTNTYQDWHTYLLFLLLVFSCSGGAQNGLHKERCTKTYLETVTKKVWVSLEMSQAVQLLLYQSPVIIYPLV